MKKMKFLKPIFFSFFTLIGLSSFSQTEDATVFKVVEIMPEFPGGNEAMQQYFIENLRYPKTDRENGVEGKVFVQFVIDTLGTPTKIEVIRSVSPNIDAEAMRLVREMPQFSPGYQNGKKVSVQFTLPMEFFFDEGQDINVGDVDLKKLPQSGWAADLSFLMGSFGGNLGEVINNPIGWGAGASFYRKRRIIDLRVNFLFSRVKQDFKFKGNIWEEDRLGNYMGFEINPGYKIVQSKKIDLISFIGLGFAGYLPYKPVEGQPVKSLLGINGNLGLVMNVKRKYRQFSNGDVNFQLVKLKVLFSPIRFKEDYGGTLFLVGIGYGISAN